MRAMPILQWVSISLVVWALGSLLTLIGSLLVLSKLQGGTNDFPIFWLAFVSLVIVVGTALELWAYYHEQKQKGAADDIGAAG